MKILKISKFIDDNTGILVRIDDVAENMNWPIMKKVEKILNEYNIKPVVGVIPNNHDENLLSFPKESNFWEIVSNWKKRGWEIAMHGYDHVYTTNSDKQDFFNYGGGSEFFNKDKKTQTIKLKKSLDIFNKQNIHVRSFFAPNHNYDQNTFEALKEVGIKEVIDGYGLMPFEKNGIKFIPQLFYKLKYLPFGIQSTQIHLNNWNESDLQKFLDFVKKNKKKFISYDYAISKTNNSYIYSILNFLIEKILKTVRLITN